MNDKKLPQEVQKELQEQLSWLERAVGALSPTDEYLRLLIQIQLQTNELLNKLLEHYPIEIPPRPAPPGKIKSIELDASTPRKDVEFPISGDFIQAEAERGVSSQFFLKLNTAEADPINLAEIPVIKGPFESFYITNAKGVGKLTLWVGTRLQFETGPGLKAVAYELGVRLKSIDTFDRRGDVLWLDDFEDNINKWLTAAGGSGASVALSTDTARSGGTSAKLTTGNLAGDYASIYAYHQILPLSKWGFEISFTYNSNMRKYTWAISRLTGTMEYTAEITLDLTTSELKLKGLNGDIVIDSGVVLFEDIHCFHKVKLVADFANSRYTRLLLDDRTYDISAHSLYQASSTTKPFINIYTFVYTNVDSNESAYVDDAIITQNEP